MHKRQGAKCANCGTSYMVTMRGQRYCKPSCQRRAKQTNGARRARERGLPAEAVGPFEIFERDEWICHICGRKTLKQMPSAEERDPESPTLDHVIPLRDPRSPGHVWSNVRTAHRRCNNEEGRAWLRQGSRPRLDITREESQ